MLSILAERAPDNLFRSDLEDPKQYDVKTGQNTNAGVCKTRRMQSRMQLGQTTST